MIYDEFKNIDPDKFHGTELTLHDCIADTISFENGILRFCLPDGFWITPHHNENTLNKTVRTDASVVDFRIENIDDITIRVFTRNIFRKTSVELWEMCDFIKAINSGKYTIEFLYQYRSHFEQMWQCVIHSKKKLYFRECQLHLPRAEAVFRWNNLRPDCEW